MWRIGFTVGGMALIMVAHAVIWLASGQAESSLGSDVGTAPKDVAVAYVLMVSIGFVLLVGIVLQSVYNTWTSLITSGQNISREQATSRREEGVALGTRLGWGLTPYLTIALLFGLYVRLAIERRDFVPWMLTDPSFLAFSLSWPYHFLAAAAPWGLTVDKFY